MEQMYSGIRSLSTRIILYQQNIANALGVYNNDLKTVDILRETGPITAGELSRYTGLATGTITSLIDRLELSGYVKRQHDPSDRRRVIIVPTYEQKSEVQEIYKPIQKAMDNLCTAYSEEELKIIHHFINSMSGMLEKQIQPIMVHDQNTSPL
ncbi:YcgE protein [Paenibacillus pini JCM 16418]|uniref:YcgE protein n=2 Tax=Paenibacillus TaxID=44249 RepID=W7YZF3_9BACL|nr:YcgE protein [Paenibacillus pini JCM 16418]